MTSALSRAGATQWRNETNPPNETSQTSKAKTKRASQSSHRQVKEGPRANSRAERTVWRPSGLPLTTNPEHPTHYEPSGSVPGAHFLDLQGLQALLSQCRPGGRRPIVAGLRPANGRAYGRPDSPDLRSFAYLELGFSPVHPGQIARFLDIGGMGRNTTPAPAFFTERTLAAYLAVSDRTIRNWIRRGELASYKLGASRRIDPADVDAFLAQRRDETP